MPPLEALFAAVPLPLVAGGMLALALVVGWLCGRPVSGAVAGIGLVAAGLGLSALTSELVETRRVAERAGLETRLALISAEATRADGLAACLADEAPHPEPLDNDTRARCENLIGGTPQRLYVAKAHMAARLALAEASAAHQARHPRHAPVADASFLRVLERDRFGLVAEVLLARGCTTQACPPLTLFADATRLKETLATRPQAALVARAMLRTETEARRGDVVGAARPAPDAAPLDVVAPAFTAPPGTAVTERPAPTGRPLPPDFPLPSASSIPRTSIMDTETAPRGSVTPRATGGPRPESASAPAAPSASRTVPANRDEGERIEGTVPSRAVTPAAPAPIGGTAAPDASRPTEPPRAGEAGRSGDPSRSGESTRSPAARGPAPRPAASPAATPASPATAAAPPAAAPSTAGAAPPAATAAAPVAAPVASPAPQPPPARRGPGASRDAMDSGN